MSQMERAAASLGEVIEVLTTMMKEFADQEVEDKENWEKYQKWSDDTEVEKNNFIQEQSQLVMATTATMNSNKQMVAKLTDELATLAEDIAETIKSIEELVKMRAEEKAAFEVTLADLVKTIKAVLKATDILEGHYATASAAELNEVRTRIQLALTMYGVRSEHATQTNVNLLSSFLQTGTRAPDFLNTDGSKYDSYEKQGGAKGVIGMLTDLREQLEAQKQDAIAKENEAVLQFQTTKAAKEADLHQMKTTQAEKQAKKEECEAVIQQCIATIDQAEQEIADAKAYLVQLLEDRKVFTKAFAARNAQRKQEQAATQAALDALQAVSAGAKDGVGEAFMQRSFIQISSAEKVQVGSKMMARMQTAFSKLRSLGEQYHSPSLIQMATVLKSLTKQLPTTEADAYYGREQQSFFDQGKFGPVLKLLNDLIVQLEEEQAAETSQHEWCETEKENSVNLKTERETKIHELKATIDSLTTTLAQLKTEILFLESEIERVKEETRIAKQIREDEHKVYVQAKADHEEVIKAIQTALEALTGQYALIQVGAHHKSKQPGELGATPFAEFASGASGAGSAMQMLEDLQAKYTQALETIISDEQTAQKLHEELLKRNALFIEETTYTKNEKLKERRAGLGDIGEAKESMKVSLIELHEVSKYLQDLRPSCDDIRSTFEERKKRREAEIAALKEALEVISDPTMVG
jgi:chromosome segregation ATPase